MVVYGNVFQFLFYFNFKFGIVIALAYSMPLYRYCKYYIVNKYIDILALWHISCNDIMAICNYCTNILQFILIYFIILAQFGIIFAGQYI